MEWTKESPTVSGWYWWRQDANDEAEVGRVHVDSRTAVFPEDSKYYSFRILGGEWLGPITPQEGGSDGKRRQVP